MNILMNTWQFACSKSQGQGYFTFKSEKEKGQQFSP